MTKTSIDEELRKASNKCYFAHQNNRIFNNHESNKLFHDAMEEQDIWLYAKTHYYYLTHPNFELITPREKQND